MNNPNNLFSMMQTGGMTSTAGGAALARALQRQRDTKKLERQARSEARRQKRGSLFGSIGSLAGGLLGAAIPGLGTVIGAGIGSALGKGAGEVLGAGKTQQYDRSGTVFGQQDFRDVQQASRDYTRGMGERALLAGAKTALTAGLSPDGGIYGDARSYLTGLRAPVAAPIADTTLMDSLLQVKPTSSFTGRIPLSDMGSSFSSSALPVPIDSALSGIDYSQPYNLSLKPYMHGGLAGYQDGGYTASGVLQQAGLSPTEEQLKLFQQYDPSKMQEFQSSLQQNLLSGTRQAQQQSAGMGFAGSGAVQQAQSQQREMAASDLQRAQEASQRAFESQTLGTAADLLAGGAEILGADGGLTGTFVTELPTTNQGRVTMNGQNYIWSEEEGQYILDT